MKKKQKNKTERLCKKNKTTHRWMHSKQSAGLFFESAGREELKVMEAMFCIAVGRVARTQCYEEG